MVKLILNLSHSHDSATGACRRAYLAALAALALENGSWM